MPAGVPWLTEPPRMFDPPIGKVVYRVVEKAPLVDGIPEWGPLDANPHSGARFSLKPSHAMFYVADSPEGALWEALLRYTRFGANGRCEFPVAKLKDQQLVRVRLVSDRARVLVLSRPELLHLFPDGDSPEVEAVSQLVATHDHASTHSEAQELLDCLQSLTPPIAHMPILRWKSRQFPDANVYLAYDPQVDESCWELVDDPTPLDTSAGIAMIRAALQRHGFLWDPTNTFSTSLMDDATE